MYENCFFIFLREYKSGVVMEVVNLCSFVIYSIEFYLLFSNM